VNLQNLNLSHNRIKVIENLGQCVKLRNLDVSHNLVETAADLQGLVELQSLSAFDLRNNQIEKAEGVVELLISLSALAVFYFKGNTAWRHISHLRKKLICGLPTLTYFEDKPVHDIDRITAMAW